MLKFFAKYQKILLVVGGSILMVIFLLPAGGQFLQPDPASQPIGTVNGRQLTLRDQRIAAAEIQLVQSISPQLGQNLPADELRWLLLIEEARKNGLYVSRAQAKGEIDNMISNGVPIGQILQRAGANEDLLTQAMQHAIMILQLTNMILDPGVPSEPRLAHTAQAIRAQAKVDLVGIDADQMLKELSGDPSEQQVKDLYDKYKTERRGNSEPYGFGYYLPRRVKLEYISVPLSRVTESIEVDEVEAQKFYAKHPERYMKQSSSDSGDNALQLNEQSGPLPYRQVRDRVIDELTRQLAREKQNRIVKQIVARLSEHQRHLTRNDKGYYELSDDYTPLSFERISKDIQAEHNVLPDVVRIENRWLSLQDVSKLEGFGNAGFDLAGQRVGVAPYIASTRELNPAPNNPLTAMNLQTDIASRPVTDNDGNEYIFRLLAAEPAREPKSLDEVREQVVADAKRLEAYQLLKERAQKLLDRAQSDGLSAMAKSFESSVTTVGPFSGRDRQAMMMGQRPTDPPTLPVVGQSEAFIEGVFDLGREIQQAGGLESANDAAKMTVIPIDGQQKVVVVKLTEYDPVDSQTYTMIKPMLPGYISQMSVVDMIDAQASPLQTDQIKKRIGFLDAQPDEEEADAESSEQAAQAGETEE